MKPLAVVVGAVVVAQVAVPAYQLRGDEQRRWGWQMYAGRTAVVQVEVLDEDGRDVPTGRWASRLRPEVQWEDVAPAALCEVDRAATVRVVWSDGRAEETTCSR